MNRITATHKAASAPVSLTSSVTGMYELLRASRGIVVLLCYLGQACLELQQVHAPPAKNDTCLSLLAHPDIRRSARVRAFFESATGRIREGALGFSERP